MIGNRLTQADVTATCVFTFLCEALPIRQAEAYPALSALSARCEGLPAFRAAKAKFFAPG
jgi:glutathione S-transferase